MKQLCLRTLSQSVAEPGVWPSCPTAHWVQKDQEAGCGGDRGAGVVQAAKGGGHSQQKEQFVQRCRGVKGYVLFRLVTKCAARVKGV